VSNPAGIVLGGDFAGLHVPEGTGFVLGDYNIKRTRANGQEIEPLIIRFRGAAPGLPPTIAVPGLVYCDTTSADFGEGIAQGSAGNTPVGGGMVNPNYRNIITFNANGGI